MYNDPQFLEGRQPDPAGILGDDGHCMPGGWDEQTEVNYDTKTGTYTDSSNSNNNAQSGSSISMGPTGGTGTKNA